MLLPVFDKEYVPGTNLKGSMSGANWTFALPRLELQQIVCLGAPREASLRTLCRIGRHVIVITDDPAARERVSAVRTNELSNLAIVAPFEPGELPVHDGSADLLVLTGRNGAARLRRDPAFRRECRRVLAADGLMYLETWSPLSPERARRRIEALRDEFGPAVNFWLTPTAGEGKTVVDADDVKMRQFFLNGRLDAPTITTHSIKRLFRREERESADGNPQTQTMEIARPPRSGQLPPRDRPALFRRAGRAFVRKCQQLEHAGRHNRMLSDRMHRTAFLMGADAGHLASGPPRYLREIANKAGIDIHSHRWGMAAGDGYESRKVLFFLFPDDGERPEFIVKMTRNSRFNARLEWECRALRNLHGRKLATRATLPEVVFSGVHGGLQIVGESMIDGVPFDRCPPSRSALDHARDAAEWLTNLGRRTATPLAATPRQIARWLGRLLNQFRQTYRPSVSLSRFLERQLDSLAQCLSPVPLVFQHGDPGRWNVLITPQGRAAFLDWEAADPNGLPLWDLFYFLRSYGIGAHADEAVDGDVERATRPFLTDSALNEFFGETTARYCREVGVVGEAIAPLFYTCWMHRSLKESTRRPQSQLHCGHYVRFLERCADNHRAPVLQRLFAPR